MPALLALVVLCAGPAPQTPARNVWEVEYARRAAADMAAQFESDSRPVYRHRTEIVSLLDLTAGTGGPSADGYAIQRPSGEMTALIGPALDQHIGPARRNPQREGERRCALFGAAERQCAEVVEAVCDTPALQ